MDSVFSVTETETSPNQLPRSCGEEYFPDSTVQGILPRSASGFHHFLCQIPCRMKNTGRFSPGMGCELDLLPALWHRALQAASWLQNKTFVPTPCNKPNVSPVYAILWPRAALKAKPTLHFPCKE